VARASEGAKKSTEEQNISRQGAKSPSTQRKKGIGRWEPLRLGAFA
jgi:hypothetical protein